jgi:metal-responsive CopG/Arc/MetJ family transcriptional regulator
MPPEKREQIAVKIPKILLTRLQEECDRTGRKRSDIILQAVDELLVRFEGQRGSVREEES